MNRADVIFESIVSNFRKLTIFLVVLTGLIYYASNPKPQNYYDYTFRVAERLLDGSTGLALTPPSWLNEFVLLDGSYYSVFPLGGVLSMLPFALLKVAGILTEMPGAFISALLASAVCFFLLRIAARYDVEVSRMVLLTMAILFGTFMWTNLTFAGAWQLALGFAVVGELGAIYYAAFERRPLLAGVFFAIAFGNRTEILLTAPLFLYLLVRPKALPATAGGTDTTSRDAEARGNGEREKGRRGDGEKESEPGAAATGLFRTPRSAFRNIVWFCVIPFMLGVATLLYNYARFHSITDFGYARIPGVLNEPWYNHGIFSLYYIPRQAWEMLWRTWEWKAAFPHFVPSGFSSSILWSSPFLFFLIRPGSRDKMLKCAAWAAVAILTVVLWMHGNSGGWQFGYRYAMVLLPWAFLILLENSPKKITPLEWTVYGLSFAMNLYATWLFHWTNYIKP